MAFTTDVSCSLVTSRLGSGSAIESWQRKMQAEQVVAASENVNLLMVVSFMTKSPDGRQIRPVNCSWYSNHPWQETQSCIVLNPLWSGSPLSSLQQTSRAEGRSYIVPSLLCVDSFQRLR